MIVNPVIKNYVNVSPSSSTSPLGSYKEVPLPWVLYPLTVAQHYQQLKMGVIPQIMQVMSIEAFQRKRDSSFSKFFMDCQNCL